MNRPLFFAVMCFALGEVIYIIAKNGDQIGAIIMAPICVAIILIKLNTKKTKIILFSACMFFGVFRMWIAEKNDVEKMMFGDAVCELKIDTYEGYTVSYIEYDENFSEGTFLKGIGVVDSIIIGDVGYNVTIKMVESHTDQFIIWEDYKVIAYGIEPCSIGDMVKVEGVIKPFLRRGNPGEFNSYNYYKAREIIGRIELKEFEKLSARMKIPENCWYRLKAFLYDIRNILKDELYSICDEKTRTLYSGILLGVKSGIPDIDMLLFRISGMAHIFAISGLHIGIVGGLLYKLLRKAGFKFLPAAVLAMIVTLMYAAMTGFSFSTIRAVIMLGLSLGGEVVGRRYDMLTGMGLALGVLLMVEPFRILDGGLILSFGAVAGVVLSKYVIKLLEKNKKFRGLQKKKYRWIYGIISACIFSVGINVVTSPLVAYMYYQVPLYSIILNMFIVPIMTVTVYCGFCGVLMGLFNPFLGKLIIYPGVLSLKLYGWICKMFQKLPFHVINTGKPKIEELAIYYLVLVAFLVCLNSDVLSKARRMIYQRTRKWIPYMKVRFVSAMFMSVCFVVGTVGILAIRLSDEGEQMIFLDVGQGDGIFIHTEKGTNMVIDVGSTTNNNLGEYVAYPGLLAEGMGHVDYWFITHFDTDHISGLEYLLNLDVDVGIHIDNIVVSDNVNKFEEDPLILLAKEKGINVVFMKKGDRLTDQSFVIEALHPGVTFDNDDRNEQSLVLSYDSNNMRALFTGDIGEDGIKAILENDCLNSGYDVLKVPHHGSKYSYSMKFLEQVNPYVSIISCANRNSYGHPHKEMLDGLVNVGSNIYRTDYVGAIRIRVKKNSLFTY